MVRIRTLKPLFSEETMSKSEIGGVRKWGVGGFILGPAGGSGWFIVEHYDGSKGNYAEGEFEVVE